MLCELILSHLALERPAWQEASFQALVEAQIPSGPSPWTGAGCPVGSSYRWTQHLVMAGAQ